MPLKYLNLYGSRGIKIVKGEGQYVWDSNGNKYLDCHTGHGVAFLGHRNPKIVNSIKTQLDTLITLSTSYESNLREEAVKSLERISPNRYGYVYLLNSGSECVDFALKISRKVRKKTKFISFINSFHGRTFGALSVTWNPKYREPFKPLIGEVEFLKYNDSTSLDKYITDDVAAVIVEPVQGEGGVNPATHDFMKYLRQITQERGVLLIVDEIQTGCGRTGKIWASDIYGVYGDVMLVGKALGGGFPVSAALLTDEVGSLIGEGDHGSTFGANPLALAAIKAGVDVIVNDDVPSKAERSGKLIMEGLSNNVKDLKIVRGLRGLGLMIGVELRFDPKNVIECLQRNGVLALKAGTTVVRMLPPYLINDEDIRNLVSSISRCLNEELTRRIDAGTS
ncbi:MAG: aspartate aminotransferase family protein [Sulfolobales archaeon]